MTAGPCSYILLSLSLSLSLLPSSLKQSIDRICTPHTHPCTPTHPRPTATEVLHLRVEPSNKQTHPLNHLRHSDVPLFQVLGPTHNRFALHNSHQTGPCEQIRHFLIRNPQSLTGTQCPNSLSRRTCAPTGPVHLSHWCGSGSGVPMHCCSCRHAGSSNPGKQRDGEGGEGCGQEAMRRCAYVERHWASGCRGRLD